MREPTPGSVRDVHTRAMHARDEAEYGRHDRRKTRELRLLAMSLEIDAARMVKREERSEPTRSILYRSAAWLAVKAHRYDLAIELVEEGDTEYTHTRERLDFDELRVELLHGSTLGELLALRGALNGVGHALLDMWRIEEIAVALGRPLVAVRSAWRRWS